jgi:hypothetical protein
MEDPGAHVDPSSDGDEPSPVPVDTPGGVIDAWSPLAEGGVPFPGLGDMPSLGQQDSAQQRIYGVPNSALAAAPGNRPQHAASTQPGSGETHTSLQNYGMSNLAMAATPGNRPQPATGAQPGSVEPHTLLDDARGDDANTCVLAPFGLGDPAGRKSLCFCFGERRAAVEHRLWPLW